MNLVKAADDIKNLSDQQLLSAGQNPVMIPPYLVLAEMKRREQLRAQYAKAQQQQQPSVAQQLAQNLAQPQQGQPQQGAPQGPPPQGIMQAAPPQAMAMAQGGHVARYADGGKGKYSPSFEEIVSYTAKPMEALVKASQTPTSAIDIPNLASTPEEFMLQFRKSQRTPEQFGQIAEQMLGKPDYSKYEELVRRQRQLAESKKPSLGDALIAAGTAIASNRDPRVGLASLLAQGIGVGSQSYKAAKEQREKDINAAMMAEMSLERMRQQDQEKKAATMMNLMQMDSGQLQTIANNLSANQRTLYEAGKNAENAQARMKIDIAKADLDRAMSAVNSVLSFKQHQASDEAALARVNAANQYRISAPRSSPQMTGLTTAIRNNQSRLKEIDEQLVNPRIKRNPEMLKSLVEERKRLQSATDIYTKMFERSVASGGAIGGGYVPYTDEE
jgi:hypothetical protein